MSNDISMCLRGKGMCVALQTRSATLRGDFLWFRLRHHTSELNETRIAPFQAIGLVFGSLLLLWRVLKGMP